jgi:hypothetical protein
MARLGGDPAARALIARTAVLPVTLAFRDETAVGAMLRRVVKGERSSRSTPRAPGAGA